MAKDHDTDSSITASYQDEVVESVSDLLGGKKIVSSSDLCLLRIHSSKIKPEQLKKLKCESAHDKGFIVFGPLKKSSLEKMVDDDLLGAFDEILEPNNRWLPAKDFFDGFSEPELTATMEVTHSGTVTGSMTVEMDTNEDTVESLDLEIEDEKAQDECKTPMTSISEEVSATTVKTVSKPNVATTKPKNVKSQSVLSTPVVQMLVVAVSVVFIFFGVKFFLAPKDSKNISTTDQLLNDPIPENTSARGHSDWPEWISPLSSSALYTGDDTLYAKLGPFIEGTLVKDFSWTDSQLKLLSRLSSPATASWAARKLSSNIIAIDHFKAGRMQKAQDILTQIYRASPEDFVTILNLATFYLKQNDFINADELSTIALRLCSQSDCWYPNLVKAQIKTQERQWEQADMYFAEANKPGAESLIVLAMWANSLDQRNQKQNEVRLNSLIDKTIWTSPLHTHTSPTPFGLGAELLYADVGNRFQSLLNKYDVQFTAAQRSYLSWRFEHLEGRSSLSNLFSLKAGLNQDSSALSSLILSYVLALQGDFDTARETLGSSLSLVDESKLTQPWPWSLAGDLQVHRGALDQSLVFYQTALNRSPRDAASLHGIGLIHRKKSDFIGARQKFSESVAVNSNFIPSRLRVSRLEWLESFWRK